MFKKRTNLERKVPKLKNSRLGKSIPETLLPKVKQKFLIGKNKVKSRQEFKFLKGIEFPFGGRGRLKRNLKAILAKKVYL